MAEPGPETQPKLPRSAERMVASVRVRAARIERRKRGYTGFWRPVATIGLIGWTVVLPMLAGIAVGTWIDYRWPTRYSWTLMLLVLGLALGCVGAWARIKEGQEDR